MALMSGERDEHDGRFVVASASPTWPATRELLTVHADGRVTLGAGITPDAAAQEFWKAVAACGPAETMARYRAALEEIASEERCIYAATPTGGITHEGCQTCIARNALRSRWP